MYIMVPLVSKSVLHIWKLIKEYIIKVLIIRKKPYITQTCKFTEIFSRNFIQQKL